MLKTKPRRIKDEIFLIVFGILFFLGCTTSSQVLQQDHSDSFKISNEKFTGLEGCAIVYDMKLEKIVAVYGEKRCRERFAACSTFKWPLAIMAFDVGILKDENSLMKWDGVKRSIDSWNQDQTAATWMKNSAVWYSQKITPQLGEKRIKNYLREFDYGNQDMSAGLTSAWLTITKLDADPGKGSLKISAFEQLEFLKKFWRNKLPVSPQAIEKTKKVTFLETSPSGFEFHGKTGSGYLPDLKGDFGWFIGHLQADGREYAIVTAFTRNQMAADARYPGMLARDIAKDLFKDNSLW